MRVQRSVRTAYPGQEPLNSNAAHQRKTVHSPRWFTSHPLPHTPAALYTYLTQDHSRLLALAPPALAQMFAAVYLLTQWVSEENLTAIVTCGSDWSACVPCVPTQFPIAAGYSTWTPLVWEQIVAVNSTTGRRFALMRVVFLDSSSQEAALSNLQLNHRAQDQVPFAAYLRCIYLSNFPVTIQQIMGFTALVQ